MNKIKFSTFVITLLFLLTYGSFSNAEEIVLCLNSTDQYVVIVNEEGDCLEDETQMKMSGTRMAELKSLTPVANFENNNECETEGTVTEIGFDQNGNSKLDEDEINTTASTCALPVDEESDE